MIPNHVTDPFASAGSNFMLNYARWPVSASFNNCPVIEGADTIKGKIAIGV